MYYLQLKVLLSFSILLYFDRRMKTEAGAGIKFSTEKEAIEADAENQIFDVKGSGWGRRR